ncbi:MAG: hypothetical protein A3F68_02035 [Acidobacteria bacterium RIFCSPLOWO2_12_FULL_54_10]|nr:MAG: hypothetical protein A3F68_02035 [Acidobacteria bacterium RIFCSPLOWO2_12_FULL_54_10]
MEQRRQHRLDVALEIRLRGTDALGLPFEEKTQSSDVSRGGCSIQTSLDLPVGTELEMEILRRVPGHVDLVSFLTRGIVKQARSQPDGNYTVGILITGPQFPTYTTEGTEP